MKINFLVIVVVLIIVSKTTAQDQVSLLEIEKVKVNLMLNADQYRAINSKVVEIKEILEEDRKIIAALKARFKSGDEPGFFEKIRVKNGRDRRVNKINDLLEDIGNQLNDEQKEKYRYVKKPELKTLSQKELYE